MTTDERERLRELEADGRWRPLAEARVVRRHDPTVVPTGQGALVWGGEALRAPVGGAR